MGGGQFQDRYATRIIVFLLKEGLVIVHGCLCNTSFDRDLASLHAARYRLTSQHNSSMRVDYIRSDKV